MNAHALAVTVAPEALALAATNEAILRALEPAAIQGGAAVAKASGVPQKNIDRALASLLRQELVEKLNSSPAGWHLTKTGRRALQAIDLANGRVGSADPEGSATPAAADPSALLLLHHHIRPNPLQPRKIDLNRPKDRLELDQLKASIAADLALGGPGVLQNLTVYPADEEGIHTLSAGERRWRAVGELIAEGVWPSERPLRATQRDMGSGLTAFIALVENGQRQNLALIEEARGYAALIEETRWSARHAALQTGRDPRTVQEMLKVLREADADDIARHEADPEAYTWEDLRASVRKPTEGEGEGEGRDPNQLDIEEAAASGAPAAPSQAEVANAKPPPISLGSGSVQPPKPIREPDPPTADLPPAERLAMLELAHKLAVATEHGEWTRVRRYWLDTAASALKDRGFVVFTHHLSGGPHAGMPNAGKAWVKSNFSLVNAGVITVERQRLKLPRQGDGYSTPWLNDPSDAGTAQGIPSEAADLGDDGDEAAAAAAEDAAVAAILADVRGTLNRTHTAAEIRELLGKVGLQRPFAAADDADNAKGEAGVVYGVDGDEAAVADTSGCTHDSLAQARAELIAYALNLASGETPAIRPPIPSEPVDRLAMSAEAIRQLLLRDIDPASGLFVKVEDLYATFSSALADTKAAIDASKAAAQAEG